MKQFSGASAVRRWVVFCALVLAGPVFAEVEPHVVLSKVSPPSTYRPGGTSQYTVVLTNSGSTTMNSGVLNVSFSDAASVNWSCAATGTTCGAPSSGSGNISAKDPGNLGTGDTLTYTFDVSYGALTVADPVTASASLADGELGANADTDSASLNIPLAPNTDFRPRFDSAPTTYTPGTNTSTLNFDVFNDGRTTSAAVVNLPLPTGASGFSWACSGLGGSTCNTASGTGAIVGAKASIVAGGKVSFSLTAINYAASATGNVTWSAAVTADTGFTEGDPSNNSASKVLARAPVANFSAVFGANPTTFTAGSGNGTLSLVVSNAGPSDDSVTVALPLPAGALSASWACTVSNAVCPNTSGTGSISETVSIQSGGSATFNLTNVAYRPDRVTDVTWATTLTSAADSASPKTVNKVLTVVRSADIQVEKTAVAVDGGALTSVSPGGAFTYRIKVTNLGPSDVGVGSETGIQLNDTFPANVLGDPARCGGSSTICWEVCGSDGGTVGNYRPDSGTCPNKVSGTGPVSNQGLKLKAGSSTMLIAPVAVGSLAAGSIVNAATVSLDTSPVVGDAGDANNRDEASVTVALSTDLQVEKTDDGSAVPGTSHSYSIRIRNSGFVAATGVVLNDAFPIYSAGVLDAGFSTGTVSWQCATSSSGACCNPAANQCGLGTPTPAVTAASISNLALNLPAQGEMVFTVTGTLHPSASGTLSNTATVTAPVGLGETNPANNTSTDTTLLTSSAVGTIVKTVLDLRSVNNDDQAPFEVRYRIVARNRGPSVMTGAVIEDLFIDPLQASTATWTCQAKLGFLAPVACPTASGGGANLNETVTMRVNETYTYTVTVQTSSTVTGLINNTARLTYAGSSWQSTAVTGVTAQGELGISKDDFQASAVPGADTEYVIRVENLGPDDAFGARVVDVMPPELEQVSWTCSAATPIPGNLSVLGTAGAPETAGTRVRASPDGRHVYAIVQVGAELGVQAYSRNAVPGVGYGSVAAIETEVNGVDDPTDSGVAVAALSNAADLAISPDGAYVYVLTRFDGSSNVLTFARNTVVADPGFGRLNFAGAVNDADLGEAHRLIATSQNLYVLGSTATTPAVVVYRRDVSTGVPIFDVDQMVSVPTGRAMAVDSAASLLFVAGVNDGIATFRINPASGPTPFGRLSFLNTTSDASLSNLQDLVAASSGRHLYALSAGVGIVRLSYTSAGAVTVGPVLPAATLGANARVALSPDGEHLVAVDPTADLVLRIRRDVTSGGLAAQSDSLDPGATAGASDVAFASDGRHVFVATAATSNPPLLILNRRAPDPRFSFLEVDLQGDSSEAGPIGGLTGANGVEMSSDGKHVYAIGFQDNAIVQFKRDAEVGVGSPNPGTHLEFERSYVEGSAGITGLIRPVAIHLTDDGATLLVSSEQNNALLVFDRNPADGVLSYRQTLRDGVGGVDGLLGARGITSDGPGSHVYVAGSFESAIAIFRRTAGALTYVGLVRNGSDGATGINGVRDLDMTQDNQQLLAVSSGSNAVAVFNRDTRNAEPTFGKLNFVQARVMNAGDGLSAISVVASADPQTDSHVYVTAENTHRLYVLKRNLDPGSNAFGTLQLQATYGNGSDGIQHMTGPRDVRVSPDGDAVYVASRSGRSVQVFDRDSNRSSASFGALTLVDERRDEVDGVNGLDGATAIAISPDSRTVHVAGFNDSAVASFVLGSGSRCSASGSGDISDVVDLAANGTLEYRVLAHIRPDALGTLENIATIELPEKFVETGPNRPNSATDTTSLTPKAGLSVEKTNDRISLTAGEPVQYRVVVRNDGPSNVSTGLTLTDDLPVGFHAISWSCRADASGALEFLDSVANGQVGISGLAGVSSLALIDDVPGHNYLAAASVSDDSLVILERDIGDGRLLSDVVRVQQPSLVGARAVAAFGQHVYVAARTADALTAFRVDGPTMPATQPTVTQVDLESGITGLDQASFVLVLQDGRAVYVAGSNDDAIAVFQRESGGSLAALPSVVNGVGGVSGLDGVEYLVESPDGTQLYAVAPAQGSIARFAIGPSGDLSFQAAISGLDLGLTMQGASSAAISPDGKFLYLTVTDHNRVLIFARNPSGDLSFSGQVVQGENNALGLLAPTRVVLSGDGVHAYVSARDGSSVAWFLRDPISGAMEYLGQRSSESSGVQGVLGATAMALDESVSTLYVAGTQEAAIAAFTRQDDSTCGVNGGTGDPINVPISVAAGGSVTFIIDAVVDTDVTGELVNTASIQVSSQVDEDSDDDSDSDTDPVSVVADLAITKTDGLAEFDGLAGAVAVAGDNQQIYAAAADDNAIGVYSRVDDGASNRFGRLDYNSTVKSGQNGVLGLTAVSDVVLSPDGDHVYAVSPSENSVAAFRRNRTNGRLSFLEIEQNGVFGVTGMAGAAALVISPDGGQVYVVARAANAIAVFARNTTSSSPDYGKLTFRNSMQQGVSGVDGLGEPIALAISPDGKHVYALGLTTTSIAVFVRNPNSGSGTYGNLSYSARYVNGSGGFSGLSGQRALAISPNGSQVVVLAADAGNLVRLSRNSTTGALAPAQILAQGFAGDTLAPLAGEAAEAAGLAASNGLQGARRLRFAVDGAQLYVAGAATRSVSWYGVAPDGSLSFGNMVSNGDGAPTTGGQVLGLNGVSDVVPSPDGVHLYAVSQIDAAATGFTRGANGALDFIGALFDGLGGIAPGDTVTYLITVTNAGPGDVADARIVDQFPDDFEAVQWVCSADGGAQCSAAGEGNLDTLASIPAGGRVNYAATGTVTDSASGFLSNTATVSSAGNLDPEPDNNTATDADTVLSPAEDLIVEVERIGAANPPAMATPVIPGANIAYTVTVSNSGPTYAQDARVTDLVDPALYDLNWTCEAEPVAGTLRDLVAADLSDVPATTYRAAAVSPLGDRVYAVGERNGLGLLDVFQRDPASGRLTSVQNLIDGSGGVSGLDGVADVVISGDERFIYTASSEADAVAVFARGANGSLSFVRKYQDGISGIDGIGGAKALVFGPGGSQLYVAGAVDDAIAVFQVNAANGSLGTNSVLRQSDPGMNGLNGLVDIAFINNGSHLLALAADNQSLAAFARNPASGALSLSSVVEDFELLANSGALGDPAALEVSGSTVFVASAANARISRFAFVAQPAALTFSDAFDGSAVLATPRALAYDPDQARLYVAGAGSLHLLSYLGASAELLDTESHVGLSQVAALELSPNLRQLYSFAEGADSVITWARERGSRCEIAGSNGIGDRRVDIAPGGFVRYSLDASIFANALGNITYRVNVAPREGDTELNPVNNEAFATDILEPQPDLSLQKSNEASDVVAGLDTTYFIDVANAGVSDSLDTHVLDLPPTLPGSAAGVLTTGASWTCAANPALEANWRVTPEGDAATVGVTRMRLSADGSRAFAVNPNSSALLVFARSNDGQLGAAQVIQDGTLLGEVAASGLAGAAGLALSTDGRNLLVVGETSNSLLVYGFAEDQSLRQVQKLTSGSNGVTGLLGVRDVVISRDGRRVFTAASQGNSHTIAVFTRDPATGLLTFVERVADGIGTIVPDSNVIKGVRRLLVSGDGRHLYAASTASQALARFDINASTGSLTYRGALRSSGPGLAVLAGARDVVAAPGDADLYVLGNTGIARFDRAADGSLSLAQSISSIPGLTTSRNLAVDRVGSRLYLSDASAAVHVFERDWSDGELRHHLRFEHADVSGADGLLPVAWDDQLYVTTPAPGGISLLSERALSQCLLASGSQFELNESVNLGVGGDARYSLTLRVDPSARGTLVNTARVEEDAGAVDPDPGNNEDTDSDTVLVISDLTVTKTAPETAVAGEYIDYTIDVHNAGPSDALGIRLVDATPVLSDVSWTCETGDRSTCTASGTDLSTLVADLMVDQTMTVHLRGRIDAAFIGVLSNTATVIPEPGASDPSVEDQTDTVETLVSAVTDLRISKTSGGEGLVAGAPLQYTIEVHNDGPSDGLDVHVLDDLPDVLIAPTWTCAGSGATCPAGGIGDIDFVTDMPVGSSLTIVVLSSLADTALGSVSNTATVAPGNSTDPDSANNSATDTDPILVYNDLSITVAESTDAWDPAGTEPLRYTVTVTNHGPSVAPQTVFAFTTTSGAVGDVPATCTITGDTRNCTLGGMAVGQSKSLTFTYTAAPGLSSIVVNANASPFPTETVTPSDPIPANNSTTETTTILTGPSLRVSVDDGRTQVRTGERLVYRVVVENFGSLTATDAVLDLPLPIELINASWTCSSNNGGSCGAAGTGAIHDTLSLARGQSVVYLFSALVDPALDAATVQRSIELTALVSHGGDIAAMDNSDTDVDVIAMLLFHDGFETVVARTTAEGVDTDEQ